MQRREAARSTAYSRLRRTKDRTKAGRQATEFAVAFVDGGAWNWPSRFGQHRAWGEGIYLLLGVCIVIRQVWLALAIIVVAWLGAYWQLSSDHAALAVEETTDRVSRRAGEESKASNLIAQAERPAAKKRRRPQNTAERAAAIRRLCESLSIGGGNVIADIGAGNGADTWTFADIVGAAGQVYSEEIAKEKVQQLRESAAKRGLEQVKPVLGTATSTGLPASTIDLAYMRFVYHHFDQPRAMLRDIWKALKPGGYLVVVDQRRGTLQDWVPRAERAKKHYWIAETTVVREAREEGLEFVRCAEELWYEQAPFVLVFRRPEGADTPGRDPDPMPPLDEDIVRSLVPDHPYSHGIALIALGPARRHLPLLVEAAGGKAVDIVLEEWATQKDERPESPASLNLPSVLTDQGRITLDDQRLDAAYFLDSYHLLFHAQPLLQCLHERLVDGGLVYVVDRSGSPDWPRREASHRRRIAPQVVVREMETAGFHLLRKDEQLGNGRFLVVLAKRPEKLSLLPMDESFDVGSLEPRDATASVKRSSEGEFLLNISAGHEDSWPGIFIPVNAPLDLSSYTHVELDVSNQSPQAVRLGLRVDSKGEGESDMVQQVESFQPGERRLLRLKLLRKMPPSLRDKLFGMRGYPAMLSPDRGIDARDVHQIRVFVAKPDDNSEFEVYGLCATGIYDGNIWFREPVDKLFPFIDRYGQYRHKDWPGKTHSDGELQQRRLEEREALKESPGPESWNRYGGWQGGPELQATGRFRVQKWEGKWWFVDPEGRLFWSHGVDCVRPTTAATPITDRQFYFAELPPKNSPLAVFYGRAGWAPHGYYQGKGSYETFNFTGSNLYRKYGENWRSTHRELCHQRLRSWGLNTIGNWSDPEIYRLAKTPYVATASSGRQRIEGSTGYWGKFPDPFDERFIADTRENVRRIAEDLNRPACLGVFIDNELAWGDELSLPRAVLASPRDQAAKAVFVADVKAKYGSIEKLNESWSTDYASWDALLEREQAPEAEGAEEDLKGFGDKLAEQYFRVCREAVKKVAPETLYFGCRFAWVNDRAVRAAAKYCDVISFNKYAYSVADFSLPEGIDLPVIIGEFHFGALDRGMFHPGLRETANQQERAAQYEQYVRGALSHPQLIGTHWFQFGDQATTGRGDGENYQIGFLDVCDTPYPEIVAASRRVGDDMYHHRSK